MAPLLVLGGVLTAAMVAGAAPAAQDHWQLLRPGGQAPQPMHYAAFTQDPGRNRLLVFGGDDGNVELNDLWVLDMTDEEWSLVRPRGTLPTYRSAASMAFDTAGDRAVVFGGYHYDAVHDVDLLYDETWFVEFADADGPRWVKLPFTAQKPAPRAGASLVYDPEADGAGRVVLFGGYDYSVGYNDVWALDLTEGHMAWSRIDGACSAKPTARDSHRAVYDPRGDRMLVFGGWQRSRNTDSTLDELWAFDLSDRGGCWTKLEPALPKPPSLADTVAVYDSCPTALRMVIYGGVTGWWTSTDERVSDTSDSWALSLADPGSETWVKLDPDGSRPRARDAHVGAYDPNGRRLVTFGGWENQGQLMKDTWALEFAPCVGPSATATDTAPPTEIELTPTATETPVPETATPDLFSTAVAATLTALVPTPTTTQTADIVATRVAGTLTASAPTATGTPTATWTPTVTDTPDVIETSVAATLTAVAHKGAGIYLPVAKTGRSVPAPECYHRAIAPAADHGDTP